MKGLFLAGILLVLATYSHGFVLQHEYEQQSINPSLEVRSYLTRVDHFRPQDTRTVRFNYTQKMDYYLIGGPIYIYISDGGLFTTIWLDTGLMHDIAMEEGAALITTANRYFRDNLPTENASFENLEYLTLEQSLGDIANLIVALREELPESNRVILWGSGYGATLAVMARQKFPHLVTGVWSSSGIFQPALYLSDTFLYLESVIANIGGEECANHVREAFFDMDEMIWNNQGEELGEQLNLCSAVNTTSDLSVASFFQIQIEFFNQYINIYGYHGLLRLCQTLVDNTDDDTTALQSFGNWVAENFLGYYPCVDVGYYYRTDLARNIEWNQPGTATGIRQWYFHRCTQLALWETTSPINDLFPHRVRDTFHYYMCTDIFGEAYDSALLYDSVRNMQIMFGSLNPGVTNVVYTNGEMDMWFPLRMVANENNTDTEVIDIPYYGRSADLRSISQYDGANLIQAKERIRELVIEWGTNPW